MISYRKLYALMEERGLNKNWLRKNGINPKVVDALWKGKNVNMSTINDICALLNCQPGDIIEWIPDEPVNL